MTSCRTTQRALGEVREVGRAGQGVGWRSGCVCVWEWGVWVSEGCGGVCVRVWVEWVRAGGEVGGANGRASVVWCVGVDVVTGLGLCGVCVGASVCDVCVHACGGSVYVRVCVWWVHACVRSV